jgi:hypothetical protein
MTVKITNNGFSTLASGINNSATTVALASGEGARFPNPSSPDVFYATLIDTSNNLEIVKVTARSTDSLTVVRAQDNTSARAFSTGDRFELRPVAKLFEDIQAEARDLNGAELVLDADGDTSITADTDDQIDIKIAGADDFKFAANAFNVLSGSTLTVDSGATITNSGTANGFGGGITQADIWRLTTNVTSDTGGVSAFERADDAATTKVGDGVNFSTPYFSFNETGIYLIQSMVLFAPTNDSDNAIWITNYFNSSSSASDTLAECQGSDGNTSNFSQCILDVTNTSNDKVYFQVISLASGGNVTGNTNANNTCVSFIRLGDT